MAKSKSIAGILGETRRHLPRAFGSILAQGSKTGLRFGDRLFRRLTLAFAFSIVALTLLIAYELYRNSVLSIGKFGWGFFWSSTWDPVFQNFGALPFLYGTLVTSFVALVISTPVGVGVAIFLSELAPRWLSDPIAFLVELLAAIPSVLYGLIGIFVLVPIMRNLGAPYGVGMLTAGVLLAVMIVPFITSISREVLMAVPQAQREAALSLGATKWEMTWMAVLPYARSGIVGAIFLALARALGETMAVTMVIGNRPEIKLSFLEPGYTMAAVIANEFTEATYDLYINALVEVGLFLFAVTIVVNALARLLILSVAKKVEVRE